MISAVVGSPIRAFVEELSPDLDAGTQERVGGGADAQALGLGGGEELRALAARHGQGLFGIEMFARLQDGQGNGELALRGW